MFQNFYGALSQQRQTLIRPAKHPRNKCSIVLQALGPIGVGKVAISPPKKTRAPTTTKCATCWPTKWPRQTAHSGSTRAYIGPMELMDRAKATTMLITNQASLSNQTAPMNTHSHMHALFNQSLTIWLTKVALWIYGSVKRVCSNTALGPAPTSAHFAVRERHSRAGVNPLA